VKEKLQRGIQTKGIQIKVTRRNEREKRGRTVTKILSEFYALLFIALR
jgi:hypothetical protein